VSSVEIDTTRTVKDAGGFSKVLDENDTIYVNLNMSEAVNVTGAPTINLIIGTNSLGQPQTRPATFDRDLSTSTQLTFKYTLINADFDIDGISVQSNSFTGGTVQNSSGTAASRTHDAITNDSNYRVDALALSGTGNDLLIKGKLGTDDNWYFFLDTGSQQGNTQNTSTIPNGRADDIGDSNLRPSVNSIISNHNGANPNFTVQLPTVANLQTLATLSTNLNTNTWPTEWRTSNFNTALYHVSDSSNRLFGVGAGTAASFGINENADDITAFATFRVI